MSGENVKHVRKIPHREKGKPFRQAELDARQAKAKAPAKKPAATPAVKAPEAPKASEPAK